MDEESVGIFGVLLIVTVLVMSQTVFHRGNAAPVLTGVKWENVVSAFGCDPEAGENCYMAMRQ
ncbi:MAG: hypothetical protein ACLQJR_22820 [Stellaceae bacterium]